MQEILSKRIIGERIKNLRIEYNLSQAFIAKILSISRSNYSQIELGNQFPSFSTLNLIARYYSKSYDWILHGENTSSKESSDNDSAEIDLLITNLEKTLNGLMNSLKYLEQELTQIKTKRSDGRRPTGNK